jgi:hypothetical protein
MQAKLAGRGPLPSVGQQTSVHGRAARTGRETGSRQVPATTRQSSSFLFGLMEILLCEKNDVRPQCSGFCRQSAPGVSVRSDADASSCRENIASPVGAVRWGGMGLLGIPREI